jgi:putative DNA methylase
MLPDSSATDRHRGWYTRGYLPHFDAPGAVQSVTYRLADALPAEVLMRMEHDLAALPPDHRATDLRRRIDAYLDAGHGCCLLQDARCARVVIAAWRHFDGVRYDLGPWVVMPNHVHCMVRIHPGHPLPDIVRGWKHFTAVAINRLLGLRGRLWQPDFWDRCIRDQDHAERAAAYILDNPVRAGLAPGRHAWPWSSAAA